MTAETNGQANYGTGPKPPDPSEVVEHLKAATQEIAAAGKAFFDMVEQAMGGFFSAVTNWAGWNEPPGKGDKPRVEHIDVEDERNPKDE